MGNITSFLKFRLENLNRLIKKDIDNVIQTYIKSSGMSICILGDHLPSEELLQKICNRVK
jgi:hypothetical protein